MTPFKKPGIFGRVNTPGIKQTLDALIQYLSQTLGYPACIEAETAASMQKKSLPVIPKEKLHEHCDLLIVVGGDGSLLHAAHTAVNQHLPVLGINRGSLGFLTDILPDSLEKIGHILAGDYLEEKRFLLNATVHHADRTDAHDDALNEVAIIPDAFPHMSGFEIYVDGEFVSGLNADGLIIATPTGSTAYALSGGGPVLHPQLDAMVLVSMFPHSLTSRPLVVDGKSELRIHVKASNPATPRLSCDGRTCIDLHPGSSVFIRKKSELLRLIHPSDYRYYETLRSKLHWGKQPAQRNE